MHIERSCMSRLAWSLHVPPDEWAPAIKARNWLNCVEKWESHRSISSHCDANLIAPEKILELSANFS